MSVLVPTGNQMGLARFVQASTTAGMFVVPVMVKPNPLLLTPNVELVVWMQGFHKRAGRPANVAPQPVLPGR